MMMPARSTLDVQFQNPQTRLSRVTCRTSPAAREGRILNLRLFQEKVCLFKICDLLYWESVCN